MPVLACFMLAYVMLAHSTFFVMLMLIHFCLHDPISPPMSLLDTKPMSYCIQISYMDTKCHLMVL